MQDCRRSWWILKAENREPFDENRRQWRGKFKQWIDLTTHNREWKIGEGLRGGVVVSTVASQQPIQVWFPACGLSVWSLHVLPVYEWILSRYSGFLPLSKNMHVRLIMSVSLHDCVFRLSLCGPVMDWRPVQGVPYFLSNESWDRLQPTPGTLSWINQMDGWMDGKRVRQSAKPHREE